MQSKEEDSSSESMRIDIVGYQQLTNAIKKVVLNGNDLESTSNILNEIFVKKEILNKYYKAIDFLPEFFRILYQCAFSDHKNDNLYLSSFKLLFYFAQNCSWCDQYFIDFGFHTAAKELIISSKFPKMKKVSSFLIQIIKQNADAFHSIYDIELTEAFIRQVHENQNDDKIWPLQCLQTVISLPYFDDNPSLDLVLTFLEQLFNIEDIDIRLLDLSYSILASALISICDESLKDRAAITLYINAGQQLFNPEDERICISILTYFINLLYYNNDASLLYLIHHSIISSIASNWDGIIQSEKIVEKLATFFGNCLTNDIHFKLALQQISQTDFLPINLMMIANNGSFAMQTEIAIYCCKMINHLSVSQYCQYLNSDVINFLLDELIIDDFDLEANIICALIHYVQQIKLDTPSFQEEIDSLLDPTISERLDEIFENHTNEEKQLSNAASFLQTLLIDINSEK